VFGSVSRRLGRVFGAVLTAAVLIPLVAAPVMADVDVYTFGTVGDHHLNDTPESGGAVCRYDADGHLVAFKLRPPVVYAIDAGAGRDAGRVGYKLIIDVYEPDNPGPSAQIFLNSGYRNATAYDDQPATWEQIVRAPEIAHNDAEYRMFAKMVWYGPNGGQVGGSVHVITQYKLKKHDGTFEVVYGHCPGTLPG
jgi:hypothetical protein